MLVYICLPNDGEFEFEAEMSFKAGSPGKYSGPPEDCYPAEPDETEFEDYGPFYDMFDAVYVAAWINECPMTIEEMQDLANKVEEECHRKLCENPPVYEPECDYDDFDR